MQIGYTGLKDTDARLGARNIANKIPPVSFLSYVPFDQNNGSAQGRFVYASVSYRFESTEFMLPVPGARQMLLQAVFTHSFVSRGEAATPVLPQGRVVTER